MASFMWNELDLKRPPNFTCKMSTTDVPFKELRKLSDVFWNAVALLRNQEMLSTEAAILSRIVLRMKSKFRGDKGFKSLSKVHHSLQNLLSLDLIAMYDNFLRSIPWDCAYEELFCPTRQMLEYVLVRTQGLAALLSRIVQTSYEAASFFRCRINSGDHWISSLLSLGSVSRIWALTRHVLYSCIEWYRSMLPFRNIFKINGPMWLPEDYIFPDDLQTWLCLPNKNSKLSEFPRKSAEDSKDFSGIQEIEELFHAAAPSGPSRSIIDDIGVSISRDSIGRLPLASEASMPAENMDSDNDRRLEMEDNAIQDIALNRGKTKGKKVQKATKRNQTASFNSSNTDRKREKNLSDQEKSSVLDVKPKRSKNTTFDKLVSSLGSHYDVQRLMLKESKKRLLTRSLGDEQWELLNGLVKKLNLKLKKAEDEKKKKQLLEQIKKAFKIALS